MRISLVFAAAIALSQAAAAQGNPAVGPCAGAAQVDSAKRTAVAKPERKPRRQSDLVVQDPQFHLLSQIDQDHDTGTPQKWVVAFGVVDTTGYIDPATANITQSSSVSLSHAVCDGMLKMAFAPALLHGQKVRGLYQERFVFEAGAATQNDLDKLEHHGGDRH